MTERNNGIFETSFLPGRQFASPADLNAQLADWLPRANARTVRSLGGRPIDVFDQDLAAMTALPRARRRRACRRESGWGGTTTSASTGTTIASTRG